MVSGGESGRCYYQGGQFQPGGVSELAVTAVRNIIGQNQLDKVLCGRQEIHAALLHIVDTATENWGVKIEMVEIKDVEIPESMQRGMAR